MPQFRVDYAQRAPESPHTVPLPAWSIRSRPPAYTCNATGEITSFNPPAEQLGGTHAPTQRRPGPLLRIVSPLHADGRTLGTDALMAPGLTRGCGLRRTQGDYRTSRRLASPGARARESVHDDSGRLLGAINVLIDVTERERTEAALREAHNV
jgi:PAS domain-containing protein